MERENIIKRDEFELIRGFLRGFNKGTLTLYVNRVVWDGREIIEMNIDEIDSVNIGNWNGNQVLDIKMNNRSNCRFYPYTQVGIFTASDNSYLYIERWIKLIDKQRFEKDANVGNSPIVILKARLAKGEISVDEYNELKKILEDEN